MSSNMAKNHSIMAAAGQRRAQFTLYAIIGIVLLLLLGLALFHRPLLRMFGLMPERYTDVRLYVDSCLEQTAEDGLYHLSIQGGTLKPLSPAELSFANVSFPKRIEKAAFKSGLEAYTEERIMGCLGGFRAFPGYNITLAGSPEVEIGLLPGDTAVSMRLPLLIEENGKTEGMGDFSVSLDARAGHMIDTANTILSQRRYDIGFLESAGLNVTVITLDISRQVVVMEDTKSALAGRPYAFAFGAGLY